MSSPETMRETMWETMRVHAFCGKFNLDEVMQQKLCTTLAKRQDTFGADMTMLWTALAGCNEPRSVFMTLSTKLNEMSYREPFSHAPPCEFHAWLKALGAVALSRRRCGRNSMDLECVSR